MSSYPLTWVTRNLAVGHAPMSYAELDSLREQGIVAIVNLCGEFCDLHEIEQAAGFEVLFLPIVDEAAPDMAEMEAALAWLDEAIYLGKKVLVHCHHGIGRTGTFVTAYLLRRGFNLNGAAHLLKATRANPTNFSQWWLLRKFGRKQGRLTYGTPTPDNRVGPDLSPFYARYERLLADLDRWLDRPAGPSSSPGSDSPCGHGSRLDFIEALYLHDKLNLTLTADRRESVIRQAAECSQAAAEEPRQMQPACPLSADGGCLLHRFRPVRCRLDAVAADAPIVTDIKKELARLSREVFHTLFEIETEEPPPVNIPDTVSGKFIQRYFHYLTAVKRVDSR